MDKNCFVIMPFSKTSEKHTEEYWTKFFKYIEDDFKSIGYMCKRSEATPTNIIATIISKLKDTPLVIAVLTDFNSNVWYELGIRHSFKKNGTIMIIEDAQPLPFDISHYGVIFYKDDPWGMKELKEKIKDFINSFEENRPDNPVHHFLQGELLTNDKIKPIEANVSILDEQLEKNQKINTFDLIWIEDHENNIAPKKLFEEKNISIRTLRRIEDFNNLTISYKIAVVASNDYIFIKSLIISQNGESILQPNKTIFYIPDINILKKVDENISLKVKTITSSPRQLYQAVSKELNIK